MLTAQTVKKIAGNLSIKYGSRYFDAREKAVIDTIKPLVNKVSPLPDYFDRFCFTIPIGIYIAFTPGELDNPYWNNLDWQLATIAHENHHFTQIKDKPQDGANWAWDYIDDPYARTIYEAESFTVTVACMYLTTGRIIARPNELYDSYIKPNYFVPDNSRDLFINTLEKQYRVILAGAYPFPIVKDVADMLDSVNERVRS